MLRTTAFAVPFPLPTRRPLFTPTSSPRPTSLDLPNPPRASRSVYRAAEKRSRTSPSAPRHTQPPSAPRSLPSPAGLPPQLSLSSSERLHKVMSRLGVASRRHSEMLIASGQVSVNGRVVKDQGSRVDARRDRIVVAGELVELPRRPVWMVLHKPKGYACVGGGGRSVQQIVGFGKVVVERLEEGYSGVVVVTNEGGWSGGGGRVARGWVVDCEGEVMEEEVKAMREGVMLDGENVKTKPADVRIVGTERVKVRAKGTKVLTRVEVRVRENRSRLIRRLFAAAGLTVVSAKCVSFGPILLGSLPRGDHRYLTPNEVKALKRGVGREGASRKPGRRRSRTET